MLHIHGLKYADDLDVIEKEGTVKALYRLRDQKMVRMIGVTSHADPDTLAKALERYDFDATQMALNAGLQGRSPDGGGYWKKGGADDLFGEALPPKPTREPASKRWPCRSRFIRKLGIIAMKVTAQEGLIGTGSGKAAAGQLIRYELFPSGFRRHRWHAEARATSGTTPKSHGNSRPMSASERETLSRRLAEANKLALDYHFNHEHRDA